MKALLLALFICEAVVANVTVKDSIIQEATAVYHKFHEMLSQKVKSQISQGGIYKGAEFCANESFENIKEFNKTLADNVSLKRVSLKNRNPNSYPQDDERKILEAFDLIEKSNAYLPSEIVQMNEEGDYKIYFPSTMSSKSCKSCHGAKKGVNEKVYELFKSKYPNDKAFDFVSGQVRGAVIITVKQK